MRVEGSLAVGNVKQSKPMTTESAPNENVLTVLNDLDEWTFSDTKLTYHSGDYMCVNIDLSKLDSAAIAGLIQWHIDQGWSLEDLEVTKRSAEMAGLASDVQ